MRSVRWQRRPGSSASSSAGAARGSWTKKWVLGVATAMLLPLGVSIAGSGATASAGFNPAAFDFWVDSPVMGPIKSRVLRAADGNTNRVVYVLDGQRAPESLNGWEIETNVAEILAELEYQRGHAGRRHVELLRGLECAE